jgi:hypothetical protein
MHTQHIKNPAAVSLGRLGGLVKSERKTAANRIKAEKRKIPRKESADITADPVAVP